LGMVCSTCFRPSKSNVWPAFGPPWKRAITSYCGAITSTTLPLPSSPHCAPSSTSIPPFMMGSGAQFRHGLADAGCDGEDRIEFGHDEQLVHAGGNARDHGIAARVARAGEHVDEDV